MTVRPPHFRTASSPRPLTTIAAWLARGFVVVDADDEEHDEDRRGPVYVSSVGAVWSEMRAREAPPDRLSATAAEVAEWRARFGAQSLAQLSLASRKAARVQRGWW